MWSFLHRMARVLRVGGRVSLILPIVTFLIVSMIIAPVSVRSQTFEEFYLVDSPTAGILPHGGFVFYGGVGPSNSLLAGTMIGFYDRLMIGVSFGLQEFVGRGDIEFNNRLGFQMRLRLIESTLY